ncbi:DUF881 domain-containing protein [Herbivorax sp. ANBcel31]|uniref:DUF881 domain-containing protein n=1 Tax=Herbivorax sp. ANBcel31 TaxID=3069754 RepID=UPI0027B6188D|nr:DUF881 domain-containing protein [Herbivorax sp. ANBcel31]MDQ2085974.1 DUF881 domain-containing protein [Herbivorax sp. ANBcel31]
MIKSDKKNVMMLVFMILGFVLALQFRSVMSTNEEEVSTDETVESLQEELEREKMIGNNLRDELNESIKRRDTILRDIMEEGDSTDITQEWERARVAAGLTEVVGDGVIITLNDALEKVEGADVSNYVLHDFSLYEVLNDIKKAEPIAISINNERILSTTEIVCAGPTVRINRNRYPVPYEIKVIGDAEKIREAFLNSSMVITTFDVYNIRYQIRDEKNIVIPKYSGNTDILTNVVEVIE